MFAAEVQCRFKFVIWLKDQEAPGDEEIEKKLLVHVELERLRLRFRLRLVHLGALVQCEIVGTCHHTVKTCTRNSRALFCLAPGELNIRTDVVR